MKKLIFMMLPALLALAVFSSCEKEEKDEYVRPSLGSMTQSPNPAVPGQMVTLTFSQRQKGNGISNAEYRWSISQLHIAQKTSSGYDSDGKPDPTLLFMVPSDCQSGRYSVHITATYDIYIGDNLYDEVSGNGTLVVQ